MYKTCAGCLSSDRNLTTLTRVQDIHTKSVYLDIINEMKLSIDEDLIQLCWECSWLFMKYSKFKDKIKACYKQLQEFIKNKAEINNLQPHSSLQIKVLPTLAITPQNIDKDIEVIKYETELSEIEINDQEDVKLESDYVMENRISDSEEESKPIAQIKKDQKKETTTKIKRKVVKKIKETKTGRREFKKKKSVNIKNVFYEEVMISEVELQEERQQMLLKDDYVNALFKCDSCIVSFPNEDDYKEHKELKHELNANNYKCPICQCSFVNEFSYNYHTNKHRLRYECEICRDKSSSKWQAVKHYESKHGQMFYVCNVCGLEFGSLTECKMHRQVHEIPNDDNGESVSNERVQDEQYPCSMCHKSFKWKTSLQKHLEAHRIESGVKRRPYCEICRLSFSASANLRKHVRTSSKHQILLKIRKQKDSNGSTTPQTESSTPESLGQHQCSLCGKRYQWKGNLKRHVASHAARANGELVCAPCNRTFSSIATYQQHLHISKKHVTEADFKYKCSTCDRRFPSRGRLQEHIDWEHLKNYVHNCSVCQKVFKSHTSLYLHRQVVHKKDSADHLCDHCGRGFPNRAKLLCHMRALHATDTPYRCTVCGAGFSWHSCLSRHVRVLHKKVKTVDSTG